MKEITSEGLGELLKKIRKDKGFTQKEVAEQINVTQSIVSGWENGTYNPTFLNIYNLCKLFDVTLDELLGVEKKKIFTLTISQDDVETLHAKIKKVEEALTFIFPNQNTKLHQEWAALRRFIELLLFNTE